MTRTNYLFIDDARHGDLTPFIRAVERKVPSLRIFHVQPGKFEDAVADAKRIIVNNRKTVLDGYVIDLRLDETATANGDRAHYSGQTLAQELRAKMARELLESVPIVVWSMETRIGRFFTPDDTASDLFDMVYD